MVDNDLEWTCNAVRGERVVQSGCSRRSFDRVTPLPPTPGRTGRRGVLILASPSRTSTRPPSRQGRRQPRRELVGDVGLDHRLGGPVHQPDVHQASANLALAAATFVTMEPVRVTDQPRTRGMRQASDRPSSVDYSWALSELVFVTDPRQVLSKHRVGRAAHRRHRDRLWRHNSAQRHRGTARPLVSRRRPSMHVPSDVRASQHRRAAHARAFDLRAPSGRGRK